MVFDLKIAGQYNANGDGRADRHHDPLSRTEIHYETRKQTCRVPQVLLRTSRKLKANARSRMDKVLARSAARNEPASAPAARPSICWTTFASTITARPYPLNQVAQLHVPEPAMITVQPWDTSIIRRHRKGDPELRSRPQPFERRQDRPHSDPAAHRGAPPRPGKKLSHIAEERRVDSAQCPSRCQRTSEKAGQGQS